MTYLTCFQQNAKKKTQRCSLLHQQQITQNDVDHKINDVINVPVYSRNRRETVLSRKVWHFVVAYTWRKLWSYLHSYLNSPRIFGCQVVFFVWRYFFTLTVYNMMKCHIMQHFIWVFTVCKSTCLGFFPYTKGQTYFFTFLVLKRQHFAIHMLYYEHNFILLPKSVNHQWFINFNTRHCFTPRCHVIW